MPSSNKKGYCVVCGEYKVIPARGMCYKHYQRWRRHGNVDDPDYVNSGKTCKIDGCDKPAKLKGLCLVHNRRIEEYGSPEALKRYPSYEGEECLMPDCKEQARSEFMCNAHYHNYMYHKREGHVEDVVEYIDFRLKRDKEQGKL